MCVRNASTLGWRRRPCVRTARPTWRHEGRAATASTDRCLTAWGSTLWHQRRYGFQAAAAHTPTKMYSSPWDRPSPLPTATPRWTTWGRPSPR
ncbi:unnamed protein product, partial [Ectocarpus sp. 12 AP-2014]